MPTGSARRSLEAAILATWYPGRVEPRKAVQGSPGPVLAVGVYPTWLTTFAHVPDFSDVSRLTAAINAILNNPTDPRMGTEETLLSEWMGGPVRLLREEEHVS